MDVKKLLTKISDSKVRSNHDGHSFRGLQGEHSKGTVSIHQQDGWMQILCFIFVSQNGNNGIIN
jgi:hypothetical protein